MPRPQLHPSEPIMVTVAPTSATVLPGETEQSSRNGNRNGYRYGYLDNKRRRSSNGGRKWSGHSPRNSDSRTDSNNHRNLYMTAQNRPQQPLRLASGLIINWSVELCLKLTA